MNIQKRNHMGRYSILTTLLAILLDLAAHAQTADWRNISTGHVIPDESYSDQPYVVKTDDGAWLCVLTTAAGHEGTSGQHIIAQRSHDKGKTWVDRVAVEPADGPEASYSVLLKAPNGRIFVFYNHNTDNIRWVHGDNPPYKDGKVKRVDSQGHFVFKYSDDHGKTWSAERYDIPMRMFEIDRSNPYGGEIKFFWNVGKAFSHNGKAYVPIHKVGGFGEGFFTSSEGALLCSDNLLAVADPRDAVWRTLPDGEIGLRTPEGGGPIAEEQSFTVLSDGSFFCVYRTIDGHAAYSYSRDEGHTWDSPQYMRYADGRLMKHPRAANFVWRCENGKYLYWFHNHGGRFIGEHPQRRSMSYQDRNPVWLAGGIEMDSPAGKVIRWSEPEILFYDDDPFIRMSYPDLIEEDGAYYITETQKDLARVHEVDNAWLEGLWTQFATKTKHADDAILQWKRDVAKRGKVTIDAPVLPELFRRDTKPVDQPGVRTGKGFSVDMVLDMAAAKTGDSLLNALDGTGKGWLVRLNDRNAIELVLNDGQTQVAWASTPGSLAVGKPHHISIVVDGGPNVIFFVVNGKLDDGGTTRQFGWGRFSPYFRSANGSSGLRIAAEKVDALTVYGKALTVSQAIGNCRSEMNH